MRLKHVKGAEEAVQKSPLVLHSPKEAKGWIKNQGERPLNLEIGMGKGKFLLELSCADPDSIYIGIEMYESVMIRAIEKLERLQEDPDKDAPGHLRFIRMDAKNLSDWFASESIDRIYLNFSDPWPKARHAKRRLTSHQFLSVFYPILKKDGLIEFKTDNRELFDFALQEYGIAGFDLLYLSYDLHSDAEAMAANIMTEYEEKFSSRGTPICKYIIRKHQPDD